MANTPSIRSTTTDKAISDIFCPDNLRLKNTLTTSPPTTPGRYTPKNEEEYTILNTSKKDDLIPWICNSHNHRNARKGNVSHVSSIKNDKFHGLQIRDFRGDSCKSFR